MVDYINGSEVEQIWQTDRPRYGMTASGYGSKIPTRYMIRYAGRSRRVYMMMYGNSGSPYVVVGGETRHLDLDTEHSLMQLA